MFAAMALVGLLIAPADNWKFIDAVTYDGMTVVTYRTIDLAATPSRPLHADDRPAATARHGSLGLGPGGSHRIGVVWDAGTNAVWIDADADGRFTAGERHTLGADPLAIAIPFNRRETRTVLVRRRGDGLAYAIRGYTVGQVALKGQHHAALLLDGDADGCFDSAAHDRLWIDLDGDGRFNRLTEQFPLGQATTHAGTAFLFRPQADGLNVAVRERPQATGSLTPQLAKPPAGKVVAFSVEYLSEFGELLIARELGRPIVLPEGQYRIAALELKIAAADGRVWHYEFIDDSRAFDVTVANGRETAHPLLTALSVAIRFDAPRVAPGGTIEVRPDVRAGPLYLARCEIAEPRMDYGTTATADIDLRAADGTVLDSCMTAFH